MAGTPRTVEASAVEEQGLEIVRGLLAELGSHQSARGLTLESSLEHDLGLGSLERVELLVRFESRFKLRLPDEVAQHSDTPAEWVRAVLAGGQGKTPKPRYRIVQPAREAPPPPEHARSMVEVLRRHVEVEPDRVHIHLLEEESGEDLTYRRLLDTALSVAGGLKAAGLRRNETVAIMLPTCTDFFFAFYGVMLAGGVAVPIYPPARPDKVEEYVRRQVAILRNAKVRFLISFERVRAVAQIMKLSIPSLADATTVDALRATGAKLPAGGVDPAETALLQYTSGSTGDPKGVTLLHSNLIANIRGIGWAVKVRANDIGVSWLPLYHDMGLIGSWLFCLYYAVPFTVLSPLAFLSRPERWLWAMHDSGGTLCPAPNFAYELSARKIPDSALEGLDLSRWRVAINAGEPVQPDTLARFAERFGPYGFRAESFVPCYGLAESSVALAFPALDRAPVIDSIRRDLFESEGRAVSTSPDGPNDPKVIRFVANGRPLPEHEIKIVDEQGNETPERVQGRLLFRGPSMTSGYYRNPRATGAILDEDGWMNSGDLAYWAEGELFVTGRSKDLIIKSGRNIVPQEVESATAEVPGVRKGCVAAFGTVDDVSGTERLVVVAETRTAVEQELRKIEAEVIRSIDSVLGIPPDKVVLAPPQSIPKTSSGKIRRNETRNLYLSGKLGGRARPPWMQMVRLWAGQLGSWTRRKLRALLESLGRAYVSASISVTSMAGALLARLVPRRTASGIVRRTLRTIFWLAGRGVEFDGARPQLNGRPAVFVANRPGLLDPLVVMAAIPSRALISDESVLRGLPGPLRFLMKRLVVPPLDGDASAGGRLRDRVRQALAAGHSVLVFPDTPPGISPALCRYRLEAIYGAAEASRPLYPVGVRRTANLFEARSRRDHGRPAVVVGGEIVVASSEHSEVAGARERLRAAITSLCGSP